MSATMSEAQRRYWAQVITVTFGGKTFKCSRRTYSALQYLDRKLKEKRPNARGAGKPAYVRVIQGCYNTTVKASAGTHDFDATLDIQIVGMTYAEAAQFVKWYGWMAWHRTVAQGFKSEHVHMTLTPLGITSNKPSLTMINDAYHYTKIRVGVFVPGQVHDAFNHALGLKGHHNAGSDPASWPKDLVGKIYVPGQD